MLIEPFAFKVYVPWTQPMTPVMQVGSEPEMHIQINFKIVSRYR